VGLACPLCGLVYEPGAGACREHGCPLAGVAGCATRHCPRCGYATPDEEKSVAARWVRRLFGACAAAPAPTLADLSPGDEAVVERLSGEPALLARLTAQGLAPGVAVRLAQRSPAFLVEMDETTLALERRVAERITLRPVRESV
jgi:Fe2+ transport system protein FeoA